MRTTEFVKMVAVLSIAAIAIIPAISFDISSADSDSIEIQKIGDMSYKFYNKDSQKTIWTFDDGSTAIANQSNGYLVTHSFGTSGVKTVRYSIDGTEGSLKIPIYDKSVVTTAYTGITYSCCMEGLTGLVNAGYDMPDWMVWDSDQKRLTGTPTVTGTYSIRMWINGAQTETLTLKVEDGTGMVDPEEKVDMFTVSVENGKITAIAQSTNVRMNTWHIYKESDLSISCWTDEGNSTTYQAESNGKYMVQLSVILNNGTTREQIKTVQVDMTQGGTEPPSSEDVFTTIQEWVGNNTNTVIFGGIIIVAILLFFSRRA